MDIVFTIDDICILVDIIIANSTRAHLVSQAIFFQKMATTIITQAKVVLYHDRHPENDFIPLAIEILNVYTSRYTISFIIVST
jgi:hypothetical protein